MGGDLDAETQGLSCLNELEQRCGCKDYQPRAHILSLQSVGLRWQASGSTVKHQVATFSPSHYRPQ